MVRARFIGVGRFQSLLIRDLAGCERDARALHAIFSDTIAGLDAQLIVNEAATVAAVRGAIVATLDVADPDDVVILTLATHGTADHRVVAHDTLPEDIVGTTISMTELADTFRRCRARFVMCVLDCCFAGAAPARVALEVPPSRTLLDIEAFSGVGRLLITASRPDQPAYEHPTLRHGLLTAAILDALTAGTSDGVLAMIDDVVRRARADARSMGIEQHPVASTYIDGGFKLPTFQKGDTYRAAFPEYGGIRVAAVSDIVNFGIPASIVDAWREDFQDHLHPLQLRAINDHRVLDGNSLLVVAPTSSGKTFIGELAAVRAVSSGRKAVFLLPYRALVNEKYDDFEALYGRRLGMRIIRCAGDFRDQLAEFAAGKFDIAFLTYEMFLGRAVAMPAILDLLGLVVVDEAQMVADPSRGIIVELLLTLLRNAHVRGVNPQLVLLSAAVGAINHLDNWLALESLVSDDRPVPLELGVLDRTGTFEYLTADGTIATRNLLPGGAVQRGREPRSQDIVLPLIRHLLSDAAAHEAVIVFRNVKGAAEGAAGYLGRDLGLPPAAGALALLPDLDLSRSSGRLRDALRGGTAFHTSDLSREERVVVERAFRERDGEVRVIAATSTIAAGVNTPASTVIIVETVQPMQGNPPMTVSSVKNMAGRAGRYRYRETGRAVILAQTPFERRRLFERYVRGTAEPFTSSFSDTDVSTWVLRLLRQMHAGVPREQVTALLAGTFGGYLLSRADASFVPRLVPHVEALLTRMLALNLIDERNGLRLTELGKACGQSTISFESCLRVLEELRLIAGPLSAEILLGITGSLSEADAIATPSLRKGAGEPRWWDDVRARHPAIVPLLTFGAADRVIVAIRAKRYLIAHAWMRGVPMQQLETHFTINERWAGVGAGNVRTIVEGLQFRLASVREIVAVAAPERMPDEDALRRFVARLEFGVPDEALPLLELPIALSRGELLTLYSAGVRTAADALNPALTGRIARTLTDKLEAARINARHEV